jgi:hypothetical protein
VHRSKLWLAAAAFALLGAGPPAASVVSVNCPASFDWGEAPQMSLRVVERDGFEVLLAEGTIDAGMPDRLRTILAAHPNLSEVWLRSPGGVAVAGNQAGRILRSFGPPDPATGRPQGLGTRIPRGWTCFSACNFMFMGGMARIIEPGGVFMVHMFTFTNERGAIRYATEQGQDQTIALIGDVEQEAALLATEDNDFLLRMGISRLLLTDIMYQQRAAGTARAPAQRYCLNDEEAVRYNVANVVEQ